ncbi:MAG: S9 family peptidase [Terriglobia bacterium]
MKPTAMKTVGRWGHLLSVLIILLTLAGTSWGQQAYQKPPEVVREILDAPPTPTLVLSPTRTHVLLVQRLRYPPIADLAAPMLRLAGRRINPLTNGPHRTTRYVAYTLKRLADGREWKIGVPPEPYLSFPVWSPDGKHFAFTQTTASGIELWVGEAESARVRRLASVRINAAYGRPFQWMPDSRTVLCQTIVADRGEPPAAPAVPSGPVIKESYGKRKPARTYQDLLKNPHDEVLFDYYATAQLAFVDIATGRTTLLGQPGIFTTVSPSPDGQHLLVVRLHRPYSYLLPAFRFPREVEVWDRRGRRVYGLASLPLADQVPIGGVPTGPRNYQWRPTEPVALVWVEALDGGDPKKKVPHRDRVMMLEASFTGEPVELAQSEQRFAGLQWGEKNGLVLLRDYDRNRRWTRTFLLNADHPAQPPQLLWDRSLQDRYADPGNPIFRTLPAGHRAILQDGDAIYLAGRGASPEGDRPFLDRFNLRTRKTQRLFRCDDKSYEYVIDLVSDDGARFLTRYESPSEPPNYFLRRAGDTARTALTAFPDPLPQLRGIRKQLVTYQRADSVGLSFTLYLPADYPASGKEPRPTVLWAYPREFTDPGTASQVRGSPNRFATLVGTSHLFFLTQGYVIIDGATMPVIGDPETVNDTYVEQIVTSAQAAINKAVELGVTDPERVGVGGHSYGAFMTANLLAHSDLFRAGIARSGAYNRTLTPFGFQSERRTLWEATDLYFRISPFMFAHKINEPILLIHGDADNNSGTFPIQSQRLYHALRGNGGWVRYVSLPHESHGYVARESVEHTLHEMLNWFDKYVKNAPPRTAKPTPVQER